MSRKNSTATEQTTTGSRKQNGLSADFSKDLKIPNPRRKEAALERLLGLKAAEKVSKCPPLTPIFGNAVNVRQAIHSLRFSADPVAEQFLTAYDKIPVGDLKQLSNLVLEAVTVKAGINPNELLGAMILSFRSMQAQKSGVMAISNHPRVLKSTIEYAHLPGGERDRRMLHEAVGFIPTPKGMSLNLNFPQGASKPQIEDESSPDVNEVFPIITETQQDWQDRRQKVLAEKN